MSKAHLHGGPLDGAERTAPTEGGGQPPEVLDFEHQEDGATWYVQYRRAGHDEAGWHYRASGNVERADEE